MPRAIMRIAMLAPRFPPRFDGVGDHAAKFADALVESGSEVLVLTEGEGRLAGFVRAESIGSTWTLCAAARASMSARRFGADVFYIQYTPFVYGVRSMAPLVFALFARLTRARVAIYVHEAFYKAGSPAASTYLKWLLLAARDLLVISLADHIFVAHQERQATLAKMLPWRRRDSIIIAPTGANIEPSGARRWRLAAQTSRRRLVTFGIISPRRRLELIIDAFVILIGRGLDLDLHFVGRVGDREYASMLISRLAAVGVQDRVSWRGALSAEDTTQAFLEADGLLFASTDGATGSSSVLLSALAHGIPIVAVQTPHDEEIFCDCVHHAEPNAKSLADAIVVALCDRAYAMQLGAAGADLYDKRFRWSTMTSTIVSSMQKVAKN